MIDPEDKALLTDLFDCAVQAADPRRALAPHLPEKPAGKTVFIGDGKGAAQMAAADESIAAIGSEVAAEAYGLQFVAHDIQDHSGNTTRFLVIGKDTPAPSGNDVTSAAFTIRRDQAGALYHLLAPFAKHGAADFPREGRPTQMLWAFGDAVRGPDIGRHDKHVLTPANELATGDKPQARGSHKTGGRTLR